MRRESARAGPAVAGWLLVGLAVPFGCSSNGAGPGSAAATGADQWFTEITREAGLDFVHESGATGKMYMPEIMASGAALLDFDGDGDLDIYLTSGNHRLPEPGIDALSPDRLYRQEPGGRFVDVTAGSGLGDGGYGMGVAVGDIDNDGHVDLYVTNYGPDHLYRNRGDGTFEDVTAAAGVKVAGWSASATFCDYDRDGFLDLYVTQYVAFRPKDCFTESGEPEYCGPKVYPPIPDVLLHNDGDGTFTDVSQAAGITSVSPGAGLGVVCEDLNDDGWLDFYVANDAYPNHLWINRRDGSFRDEGVLMGCAVNLHGQASAGMGVIADDLDGDTFPDLYVTNLANETNSLYRNLGGGRGFVDVTGETGLGPSSMPFTGFGTAALDVELDGDLDLFVVNGRVNRGKPRPDSWVDPPWNLFAEPSLFYLNDGTGHFTQLQDKVASVCAPVEVRRGLAIGDIDADGDIDLLVSNVQGPARLYRNDTPRQGHWLEVRTLDPRLRRDALGARVTVFSGQRRWMRAIRSGFSYLSSSHPQAHFGLGPAGAVDRIEVLWPDGLREAFPGQAADCAVELVRGTGEPRP